ncbi:response regulator transcription factor [Clostridium grantii]|uniref:Stage 0 sporulation protein A homolog n=1 Tax=Clostridium grantii DSM 8605 TaxID=1121316 RepID=A0A1M5S587_9CLOT|nr:response regulator transcription factor [Clostridium grantii]SHH33590.1 DNA-binding response regulator, OmpR family, contains REC and winged-helix (wHTH) domain [Clostridium grantii DSM 8605]
MKKKILIADDEMRMRILISDFLINEGYEIIEASDGKEALEKFTNEPTIHLVILDIMMPYLTGWEVCEEIRKISKVPIIMLTAKNAENDELFGFKKGTDEYIKKPFSPSILVARVNALMDRTYGDSNLLIKDCLTIDTEKHIVKSQGDTIDLSITEYKLLLYMIDNENSVLSREQLISKVWGYDYDGTDRTVDTHINRLRIKLKESGDYVKTVRGYGYKFEVIK